jgi:hypothetical protein
VSNPLLDRVSAYIGRLPTRQGILGRAALGAPDPGDARLAGDLAATLAAELRSDGSVGGAAVPTIWRLHELLDLGRAPGDPAVRHLAGWVLARHGQPGAYGSGCDRARHAQRLCEHYVGGFLSPAPPRHRLAPITLPNGKVFRAEPAARFAISCLGLRGLLRAGLEARPEVVRHLGSLQAMAAQWTDWSGFFSPDVIVAGLHALALGGPAYQPEAGKLVDLIAAYQRPDGQWPAADLFAVLEALLAVGTREAHRVVRRAVPALADKQRPDGAFGATAQQERALIGLRAAIWAEAPL